MRYLLLALLVPAAFSANLTGILQEELQRNFAALRLKANPAPYYLAYSVTEEESDAIVAANGAIHAPAAFGSASATVRPEGLCQAALALPQSFWTVSAAACSASGFA